MIDLIDVSLQHLIGHFNLTIIIEPKHDHIRHLITKGFFFVKNVNILENDLLLSAVDLYQVLVFHALILNIVEGLFTADESYMNALISLTNNFDVI